MLNEKFMRDVPDELPVDTPTDLQALHLDLSQMVHALQAKRDEAFRRHKIVLPQNDPSMIGIRLHLLIVEMLGTDTPERFAYEMKWVEVYSQNIDHAIEQRRIQAEEALKPRLVVPDRLAGPIPGATQD